MNEPAHWKKVKVTLLNSTVPAYVAGSGVIAFMPQPPTVGQQLYLDASDEEYDGLFIPQITTISRQDDKEIVFCTADSEYRLEFVPRETQRSRFMPPKTEEND